MLSQTCAEETLAKAEAALREKEEQLAHLRLQHDSLRAELAAVKEGLSTSTERAEKLREEGQVSGATEFGVGTRFSKSVFVRRCLLSGGKKSKVFYLEMKCQQVAFPC